MRLNLMQKINTDSEYIPAEVYHGRPEYSASDCKLFKKTCPKVFYQSKYGEQKLEHEPALKKLFVLANFVMLLH